MKTVEAVTDAAAGLGSLAKYFLSLPALWMLKRASRSAAAVT